MNASKFFSIALILSATLLLTQCEVQRMGCTDPRASNYDVGADIDDNTCIYKVSGSGDESTPDAAGNISITNQTDEVIYFYKDFSLIKIIPAKAENFIVNIANTNLAVCKLQIWKASDISDKHQSPDIKKVYRQWSVALSNTTSPNERANWLITGTDKYEGSGTLKLTYPSIDSYGQEVIYQVDVFLNSKNGARLASLQPGITKKMVSIDYGAHYLYFRYWYSDPNSSTGEIQELGWEQGNAVVINYEHEIAEITIPFFISNLGKFGEIKVYNETSKPISVYANGALIESIAKVSGSTAGLSIIPENSATTFLIPVKTYSISAKSIDGTSTVVSFKNIEILQDELVIKRVGNPHKEVAIKNNTSKTLLIHTIQKEYLGVALSPGESSGTFLVSTAIDSLVAITADKTGSRTFSVTETTIDNLNDFNVVSIEITSSWTTLGSNYYQSPTILHSQTTSMVATLNNSTTQAMLSFEYKVSSEKNYDKFSFSINGVEQLSNISGDVNWTKFSIAVPAGKNSLIWQYKKDKLFSDGADNVEIRNIVVN